MTANELIVCVKFRPNCDLENTRAALVMRRIARLCDQTSCHPSDVAGDAAAIPYLQDNGLFVRFTAKHPEMVLSTIKNSFFVDECVLVDDPNAIPPYRATPHTRRPALAPEAAIAEPLSSHAIENDELVDLLANFNEMGRLVRACASRHEDDRDLGALAFRMNRTVDAMRTVVARSRTEPFSRIEPGLHAFVDSCAERFGVGIDFDIVDNHLELDCGVLAVMEEIAKRLLKVLVRGEAIGDERRREAGLPPRTTIRLYAESDGATLVCRCEHNGVPFDSHAIAVLAQNRGVLTRDPDDYSEEELGRMVFMPGFHSASDPRVSSSFDFRELGAALQRAGGRGSVCNTEFGTVELKLELPAPFVALDVALFTVRGQRLAASASHVKRFEAFDPHRVTLSEEHGGLVLYEDEHGAVHALLNADEHGPLAPEQPALAMLLDVQGDLGAFAVDKANGYEHVVVHKLPHLLDDALPSDVSAHGFAELNDGSLGIVLNARAMLTALGRRGFHA